MNLRPVLLVSVLIALAPVADADSFKPPPMRDGLWESHTQRSVDGKVVTDMTAKLCQSNALTQSMRAQSDAFRKQNGCTNTVTRPAPGTYLDEGRCAKGSNAGVIVSTRITYQGDVASHLEMRSSKDKPGTVMTVDSKYLGSCPAGMKPGDMVMPDGKKVSGGT